MLRLTQQLTVEQAAEIIPPEQPEAGKYWRPIPNSLLVHGILKRIAARSTSYSSYWQSKRDGAVLIGSIRFIPLGQQSVYGLSITNANDRTQCLQFGVGAVIPSDGMYPETALYCSTHTVQRKHTTGVELNTLLDRAINVIMRSLPIVDTDLATIHRTNLNPASLAQLLLLVAKRGIIPWASLGTLVPLMPDTEAISAMEVYRRLADFVMTYEPGAQMQRLMNLHQVFTMEIG